MSNDLQTLYKMRDILNKEAHVKAYNAEINNRHVRDANARVENEISAKNSAYADYEKTLAEKFKTKQVLRCIILPIIVLTVGLIVLTLLTRVLSKNEDWGLLYFYTSSLWICPITVLACSISAVGYGKKAGNITNSFGVLKALMQVALVIFLFVRAVHFASASGACHNFWTWLLAILVFIVWPITNFFFVGKASWAMLLVLVGLIVLLAYTLVMLYNTDAAYKSSEKDADVKIKKTAYDNAAARYQAAYNIEYNKMNGHYAALMKPDTSAAEKRALVNIIPAQFQDIDTVNKWIWCIEQRYANDIVGARNWYVQQEHNAAMQKKMNDIAYQMSTANRIAAQAAEDARRSHQEAMKAYSKANAQTQKALGELNRTAKENAAANRDIANSAGKIHTQLEKYL